MTAPLSGDEPRAICVHLPARGQTVTARADRSPPLTQQSAKLLFGHRSSVSTMASSMSHLLPLMQHVVGGGAPPPSFDQLSATCGLSSSLAANGFCWREQCPALPGTCPRQHINFFPSSMSLPPIPVSSMSVMNPSESLMSSNVDWRQTLRSSIESRQHKMAKFDVDIERTSDHDSGNESGHSPATNSSHPSHSPSAMTTASASSSSDNDDTLTHSPSSSSSTMTSKKAPSVSATGSSFLMNHILSKSSAPYERPDHILTTSPPFYPFGMPFGPGDMCLPPYQLGGMGGLPTSVAQMTGVPNYSPFFSSAFRPYPAMHPGNGMMPQPYLLSQTNAAEHRPHQEQQQQQQMERLSPSSSASHSSSPCSTSMALPPNARENCIVCEDKASGFHYGVMSCEGCKGFFRRTVQKSIEYNCHKQNDCAVNRLTRNRCQSCRFNKCLRVGMTKESVRQDRNRKRKSKDEQQEREVQDTARVLGLIRAVVDAHSETSPPIKPEQSLLDSLRTDLRPEGLAQIARFAHKVPGFSQLPPADQTLLINSTSVPIVLLRAAFAYGHNEVAVDGEPLVAGQSRAETLAIVRKLRASLCSDGVFNEEIAVLSAICIFRPDCPGLSDSAAVERAQETLLEALQMQVHMRGANHVTLPRMLMKLSELLAVTMRDEGQTAAPFPKLSFPSSNPGVAL